MKIVVTPVEDGVLFIVKGKYFDMSFTLDNGMILSVGGTETVFHIKGKGVWKIKKNLELY